MADFAGTPIRHDRLPTMWSLNGCPMKLSVRETKTDTHFAGGSDVAAVWQALNLGDLVEARRCYQAASPAEQDTAPCQLAQAALLFSEGEIDAAGAAIDAFCERWPDNLDGIEWAIRIHQVADAQGRAERIGGLGRRAIDLSAAYIKLWLAQTGTGVIPLVEQIVTSATLSHGARARLCEVLFNARQLDAAVRERIFAALAPKIGTWPPDSQLFWATLLLLFSDRTEEAVRWIRDLLDRDAIEPHAFAGLQFSISRAIGSGNMELFQVRHDLLTAIHARWQQRLETAMEPADRARLTAQRQPAERTGRIAILAAPLVGRAHAPTMRVLELAAALIRDHGYQVRIFVGGPSFFRPTAPVAVATMYNAPADKLLVPHVEFEGLEIGLTGNLMDDGQARKPLLTAAQILEFEPDAVIAYGDASPVQGLLAGRVPIFLMPTGSGAPVGALDRFACEWREASLWDLVAEGRWPGHLTERAVFGATGARIPRPIVRMSRAEILPHASCILAIAGTRLVKELRGAFAKRLAEVMAARPTVHLLLVGGGDRSDLIGCELLPVQDRVHTIGFAQDLAGLFCGCDIVLNPDRQGGGTGIAMAMAVGCPVLSLRTGDGATLLASDDLSVDLDAYFDRLDRLIDDETLRRKVGGRMPEQVEQMLDFESGVATVARTVEDLAAAFRAGRLPPPITPAPADQ
ncbi:glycosyltransferase [Thalassobaculum sp.]|uniref:glycosyltransferase n=1 Tax=Thalassobaculum sp. TaxID=2022740 RepID=UPI003B595BDA